MAHRTRPADDERSSWSRSGEWELAARQLRAIEAFHHARAIAAWAAAAERTRDLRQHDARRLELLRRKHEAVIGHAHEQLRSSGVRRPPPTLHPRVVLADDRTDDRLVGALEGHGIHVLARVTNGADAVGIALVEQPDVVVVGEQLALVTPEEVVRDVRRYSPETEIVAVAGTRERASACTAAGATLVLTAAVPTHDLVEHVLRIVEPRPPGWR